MGNGIVKEMSVSKKKEVYDVLNHAIEFGKEKDDFLDVMKSARDDGEIDEGQYFELLSKFTARVVKVADGLNFTATQLAEARDEER